MKLSAPIYQLKHKAKLLARHQEIPLHKALNKIATQEGFSNWSLLSAKASTHLHPATLLSKLNPGELILLGARPGHGKTLMGLQLVAETVKSGHRSIFFTLDYNKKDALERIEAFGENDLITDNNLEIDTSDEISADYIIEKIKSGTAPKLVVIDYLQLLDQKRTNPDLLTQIQSLKDYAKETGAIFVLISQIDRSFELSQKQLPELSDIRLPNPLDLTLFDKSCFLNKDVVQVNSIN
ncbi:DNA helicase [Kiloniella spongiae]|uniref:DNA helicase n=1 Tax=Kiloniella spongiae TaxID=1489064 RepID=A0A0H2MJ86_9PROT|nr:DNA helicase [Kiloniella spongiae]KLN60817.1 DNA helicase [Kiloniella spongiae]